MGAPLDALRTLSWIDVFLPSYFRLHIHAVSQRYYYSPTIKNHDSPIHDLYDKLPSSRCCFPFALYPRIGHYTSVIVSCSCQPDCLQLYRRCCGLHREKAEYKMTAAVRNMDEELTTNLKCIAGILMTCWTYSVWGSVVKGLECNMAAGRHVMGKRSVF